ELEALSLPLEQAVPDAVGPRQEREARGLLGVAQAFLGGGAQQVDPSAIDADLAEGPAPAESGQDAEPPGLGREHELAGARGVGGGRGGKSRRYADGGGRWWRRDGRRPWCVVGQRLYARAPLIRAHPRTT